MELEIEKKYEKDKNRDNPKEIESYQRVKGNRLLNPNYEMKKKIKKKEKKKTRNQTKELS
jgi:hypothetical protein